MPTAIVDGIETRYEEVGSGPALLMFAPGGFDGTLDKWSTQSIYAKVKPVEQLAQHYRCILFDRRETGQSGGRVERVTWAHYVAQGRGLLDHLGIERAHLMGGCMGCAPVAAFGVAHPERTLSMILWWPVGGAKYRIRAQQRFAEHLAFVQHHGLDGVVAHVAREGKSFAADPRGGPWASVLARDAAFAEDVRAARCRSLQADRRRHGAHAVRSRHRAGGRARGSPAARRAGAGRAGARRRARDLGRALSRGVHPGCAVLGRCGRRPDARQRRRAPPRLSRPRQSERQRRSPDHDHRHPRPLHHRTAGAAHVSRQAARGPCRSHAQARDDGARHHRRDADPERAAAAQVPEGARQRSHHLLAARRRHGASRRHRRRRASCGRA